MLSNTYIRNERHCLENSFILLRYIGQEAILGTPFIIQINQFKVDQF